MNETIFREYDIRGIVGTELVVENIYDLTCAIVDYCLEKNPTATTVALGMDGRVHSLAIKNEVSRALVDSGLTVQLVGLCPSPVLYFATYELNSDMGIMITASHNPKEYNGIKIRLGKDTVWGEAIQDIKNRFKLRKKSLVKTSSGSVQEISIIPKYIDWLTDHFSHLKNINLSAIIDCGNAVGGLVLPLLIKQMGWKNVHLLYETIDGTYPNHEADPTKEKNMREVKRILAQTNIQVGLGLDGDADRMAPMTKSGYLVPGDKLLALYGKKVLEQHPGAAIVFDIKSSSGLAELITEWGGQPTLSATGHSLVKAQMKKYNAVLGGELSCHFFFADRYFGYDDGIYAALRLFEILSETNKSLEELIAVFPKKFSSSEIRIECDDHKKHAIVKRCKDFFLERKDVRLNTLDGVRVQLPYGWGLLRASNTQPALCLRFEGDTQEGLEKVAHEFISLLSSDIDKALLQEHILHSF